MKLSLPTKLTLGKKPQKDMSEPKEEIKVDEPKYNPTEVKLMVIAIEVRLAVFAFSILTKDVFLQFVGFAQK